MTLINMKNYITSWKQEERGHGHKSRTRPPPAPGASRRRGCRHGGFPLPRRPGPARVNALLTVDLVCVDSYGDGTEPAAAPWSMHATNLSMSGPYYHAKMQTFTGCLILITGSSSWLSLSYHTY